MSTRKTDYPTGSANGMSFICNRWVYTGPQGYRVRPNDDGTFNVVSYNATSERVAGPTGLNRTEEDAHEMAARLAGTTPHPRVPVGPAPEPEHTCGPGIQYGCDVPDCDGENGD